MSQQPGPLTIGFDIGGTNLRGAVVNGRGQIIDSAHVPTPDSPKGLEEGISFVVKQLRANYDVGCGLGYRRVFGSRMHDGAVCSSPRVA